VLTISIALVAGDFHFLSDVIAGAFVGMSLSALIVSMWEYRMRGGLLRLASHPAAPDAPASTDCVRQLRRPSPAHAKFFRAPEAAKILGARYPYSPRTKIMKSSERPMKDDNQVDCSGKPPFKYRVFVLVVIAACLLFWAVHWASVATRHTM
jgi:hypothetical protein